MAGSYVGVFRVKSRSLLSLGGTTAELVPGEQGEAGRGEADHHEGREDERILHA
jgi:hypothetical protein